jgi:hypothetical protein
MKRTLATTELSCPTSENSSEREHDVVTARE